MPAETSLTQLRRRLEMLRLERGGLSSREIQKRANDKVSHATANTVLRGKALPTWRSLKLVVEALDGDVKEFLQLWIAARDDSLAAPVIGEVDLIEPSASANSAPSQEGLADQVLPTPPRPDLDLSDVIRVPRETLGPIEPIAKGAIGEVFRVLEPSHSGFNQPLAYKEIRAQIPETARAQAVRSIERSVAMRNAMDPADRAELDRNATWPLAVVVEGGEIIGTLMPLIPSEFFINRTQPAGKVKRSVFEFALLSAPKSYLQKTGTFLAEADSRLVRLALVGQLSQTISLLHKYGIVYGDLSLLNIAIAVNPPRVLLMDCDQAALVADTERHQLHSPAFTPPENRSGAQAHQDMATDVYKLGLCILRGLVQGRGVTQLTDPEALTGTLSPQGVDLVARALSLKRSDRPSAHELSLHFAAFLANELAEAAPRTKARAFVPPQSSLATPVAARTSSVYISYHKSQPLAAQLLHELLAGQLGSGSTCIDTHHFDLGSDYLEAAAHAVSRSRVVLVVMGPDWLTLADPTGAAYIHDPDNQMRTEIEVALNHKIRIVPVLLDTTVMPDPRQLPSTIASLARCHHVEVRSNTFKDDVLRLAEKLRPILSADERTSNDRK